MMDNYDYCCSVCGIDLTEDEVVYNSLGNECCYDCASLHECFYCEDILDISEVYYDNEENECCKYCYTQILYRDKDSNI